MKKLWNHIKTFWKRYVIGVTLAMGGVGLIAALNPNNSYDCTQPIKFTITNANGYTFTDALSIPQTECEALSNADIAQQEQARFDNWIAGINNHAGNFSDVIEDIQDPLDVNLNE